jgi:hypothetical protein
MSFDVGRWNLVKTTLGSLGLVRIIREGVFIYRRVKKGENRRYMMSR